MFIGLVAAGALVLVFLLLFGIVRIQQVAEDGLGKLNLILAELVHFLFQALYYI